jgi:succinate dehydrogenase/fumarate reductase flavoprotein subunit
MDCRGASEEDIEYMKHWLRHEGNIGVLDSLQEDGIDLLKNAVEFYTYGVSLSGGVSFNTKGETSLTGLYSAGQEYSGDMAFATVVGRICGENASKYSKQSDYAESKLGAEIIKQQMTILDAARNHTSGATWQEANIALQQIMLDYAGLTRSETLLDQGLRNIRRLREKSVNTMLAKNGHEMGRWLETINMVDVGEAAMLCARERKETRGKHRRTDFPFTNPLLTKTLLVRKKDNQATFDWRAKTNG